MKNIKACVGILKEGKVIVEELPLFKENELVIVISGDSFQEHVKEITGEFRDKLVATTDRDDDEYR
jgi:hypothetical protein